MSHSSQVTKREYANKHESNITSKMANIWERKIDSDKIHKPSPTTVVKQSADTMESIERLTKAGPKKASSDLRRKNTKEIVERFERMTSNREASEASEASEARNFGLSGLDKLDKRRSSAYEKDRKSVLAIERKTSLETKEDVKKMIERISKQMNDISNDLAALKSKFDAL